MFMKLYGKSIISPPRESIESFDSRPFQALHAGVGWQKETLVTGRHGCSDW